MNPHAPRSLDTEPNGCLKAPQPSPSQARCGRYWCAIQSHPQAEHWAAQNLQRAGYETYLPTLLVSRRDPHTPSIIHRQQRPLFSSYLFVHIGITDPWTPMRYTSGVRQVLMSSGKPGIVPEAILKAVQAGDALRRLPLPDTVVYRPGAPATCLYGPLKGADLVIISAATNTAKVAVPMFGAMREVTVPILSLAVRD